MTAKRTLPIASCCAGASSVLTPRSQKAAARDDCTIARAPHLRMCRAGPSLRSYRPLCSHFGSPFRSHPGAQVAVETLDAASAALRELVTVDAGKAAILAAGVEPVVELLHGESEAACLHGLRVLGCGPGYQLRHALMRNDLRATVS